MIVADGAAGGWSIGPDGRRTRWSCLARRGMLHSECEAVDRWDLEPGATIDARGRDGVCELWFVVAGQGRLESGRAVAAGDVVLRGPATTETLTTISDMCLLIIAVLPRSTTQRLAARSPVLASDPDRPGPPEQLPALNYR
jgi:hypothetical protein